MKYTITVKADDSALGRKMTGDQLDDLIVTELKSVARMLADTVLLDDLDYDDSVRTLGATLEVISYYSTTHDYVNFINSLPFDALTPDEESTTHNDVGINVHTAQLSHNLKNLGFQAYMAMAELGFISFEDMVKLARTQLQTNASKHN